MKDFMTAVKERRSYYEISNEEVIPDDHILSIIKDAVKHTPSAFNSQSARVVVLLDHYHHQVWDITKEALRQIVPKDKFSKTDQKIDSFKRGYGTVLFFEDQSIIKNLQNDYPIYEEKFPTWSKEASGMLQYVIWTALEVEGFGANLQHYNPLIDDQVKQVLDIPNDWELVAQMPFGKPIEEPGEKSFESLDKRIKIYK